MADTKVMTAAEAVRQFVHDGDCIAMGGFVTNRRPYALVREIVRQNIQHLYLEGGPAGGDVDMLIGNGQVDVMINSYIANSGFSQVCRRFRNAIERDEPLIKYDDYSLDVQTIIYHGAALGFTYVPIKNMLGSDLCNVWGITEEERRAHPKLPDKKFVIAEDPFDPGSQLCLVPTPQIDVALVHAQVASPDGTFRIVGAQFQDLDIAMAAKHTIVSCEDIISNEEIRRHPEKNTCTGMCVDAVVQVRRGAHPTQCFGYYDYDPQFLIQYDQASRSDEGFAEFVKKYVTDCPTQDEYLDLIGAAHLADLKVVPGVGYRAGLKRR